MTDLIRIITATDGVRTPHPNGERLFQFAAGTELPLLEDFSREYYRSAHAGRLVFVAKARCYRVNGSASAPVAPGAAIAATAVPAGARARLITFALGFRTPDANGEPVHRFDAGTELPLVGETSLYFQVAHGGEALFVEKARAYRTGAKAAGRPNAIQAILRGVAIYLGLNATVSGVVMMIAAAPQVIHPGDDVATGYALGIGGAVSLAIGLVLLRLGWRPLVQFALVLAGIALAIGGFELLIFAVPISAMSDRSSDILRDRATSAFLAAGISLLAVGLAATTFAIARWWRNPESRRRLPEIQRWSAIVYGGLLILAGASIAGTGSARQSDYAPTLQQAAAVGVAIPLFLLPGSILGYYGLTIARQRMNRPFRFVAAWLLLALFAGAIVFGAVVSSMEDRAVWLMSSAHASAALLPALALIAMASRGGLRMRTPAAGLTHRQLWLALAMGISVVTLVAGTLDTFIAEGVSMVVLGASGAFDGLHSFEAVTDVLRNPDLYLSRGQQAILLLAVVSIMAPVMEEGFKAMGVALVLPKNASPAVALTLGVAVGAGFGVTEASIYGLGSLADNSPIDWWALMLLRGGATTMHALNTGLLGLALYFGAAQGRVRRGLLLYLAAVCNHALWNAMTVLVGGRVIFEFSGLSDHELSMVVFGVMATLGLATFIALHEVARRTHRASPKVDESPLAPTPLPPAVTLEPRMTS